MFPADQQPRRGNPICYAPRRGQNSANLCNSEGKLSRKKRACERMRMDLPDVHRFAQARNKTKRQIGRIFRADTARQSYCRHKNRL